MLAASFFVGLYQVPTVRADDYQIDRQADALVQNSQNLFNEVARFFANYDSRNTQTYALLQRSSELRGCLAQNYYNQYCNYQVQAVQQQLQVVQNTLAGLTGYYYGNISLFLQYTSNAFATLQNSLRYEQQPYPNPNPQPGPGPYPGPGPQPGPTQCLGAICVGSNVILVSTGMRGRVESIDRRTQMVTVVVFGGRRVSDSVYNVRLIGNGGGGHGDDHGGGNGGGGYPPHHDERIFVSGTLQGYSFNFEAYRTNQEIYDQCMSFGARLGLRLVNEVHANNFGRYERMDISTACAFVMSQATRQYH
jgi:hypothetical protein